MKSQKTVGLISAGGVNQSFLARMPALLERLGPVKGASLRVSRRTANSLRYGQGVGDYLSFQGCDLIWIAAPEAELDRISCELAAQVRLKGKVVVLCETLRDSHHISPLVTAGARVASLNRLPESDEKIFVAEGHPGALAELRRVLGRDGRKLIDIAPATKPLFLLGVHIGEHLLLPWIGAAVESLRQAGFSRVEATRAVQAMGVHALRGYAKAGPKAFNRAESERHQCAIEKDLDTIRAFDRRLTAIYPDHDRLVHFFTQKRGPRHQTKLALVKSS